MGHGAIEGPTPLYRVRHIPPLGISPTPEVEGGWHPSLSYIRRGRGALLIIIFLRQVLISLSLLLLPRVDSPCLEATVGWGFLHHTHDVVLLESGSESIFFPLLYWFGARRDVGYTVCV